MEIKKFKKGEIIFKEHDTGDHMYIIKQGKVRVYKKINMENVELITFEKGEFFGEMSLFMKKPRNAYVEAITDTEVAVLNIETFKKEITGNPDFAIRVINKLLKRIEHSHGIILDLTGAKKSYEMVYGKTKNC